MRILVTGGCGFIGSAFIHWLLERNSDIEIVNLDLLSYAGNPENLAEIEDDRRYTFVHGDVADSEAVSHAMTDCKAVVHFAAESHVDKAIQNSAPFVYANVTGTQVMLDVARKQGVDKYIQVSTDEVYGALKPLAPAFTEETPLSPRNPYSASKAAGDLLALSYHYTYGVPVVVTRSSNNYGPRQFPEKLIPLMISNALSDIPLPIYGDGQQVRDWIYVDDNCRAIEMVLKDGTPGRVYNIGGYNERANIEVVSTLLKLLNKPESLIKHVPDRPGHDRRYAINPQRITSELGWQPGIDFEQGMEKTISWYVQNSNWLNQIKTGVYQQRYLAKLGKL